MLRVWPFWSTSESQFPLYTQKNIRSIASNHLCTRKISFISNFRRLIVATNCCPCRRGTMRLVQISEICLKSPSECVLWIMKVVKRALFELCAPPPPYGNSVPTIIQSSTFLYCPVCKSALIFLTIGACLLSYTSGHLKLKYGSNKILQKLLLTCKGRCNVLCSKRILMRDIKAILFISRCTD